MDIDQLVSDTFTAHEHLAPTADEILPAVRRRRGRARGTRSRPRGHARPFAIAASVGVIAAVTAGTVVLAERGHDTVNPASRPAAASTSTAGRTTRAGVPPLTMPFDLGWLPPGAVSYLARRINQGALAGDLGQPVYDGEYLLTVRTADGPLMVDVQQMPGDVGTPLFKCGTGQPVTIAGRPGVEDRNSGGPCGYEVYFTDSLGTTMYVNVAPEPAASGPADRLRALGRHVAANVRFPGTSTVTPAFGLGRLPAGLRMVTFEVSGGEPASATGRASAPVAADGAVPSGDGSTPTTSYQLARGPQANPVVALGLAPGSRSGTPGRPVQGHPTTVRDERGYLTLAVRDAVHGQSIKIASGSVSLGELYGIADHLVLP